MAVATPTIDCDTHDWPFSDVAAVAHEPYIAQVAAARPGHRIIIGYDYGHADPLATWPNTVRRLTEQPSLTGHDRDRILGVNAGALSGLSIASAADLAGAR
jgi:predicted TIM-barrel fold metal-dependent hydrolase